MGTFPQISRHILVQVLENREDCIGELRSFSTDVCYSQAVCKQLLLECTKEFRELELQGP